MLLAIESSCDESAACVLDRSVLLKPNSHPSRAVLANVISSQVKLHEKYGGVVPELAAREHLSNLPLLVEEALAQAGIGFKDLTALAVTQGPGLNACLLIGISIAKSLAYSLRIPLLPINHMEGHLYATRFADSSEKFSYPALILLASGGHTEIVLLKDFRDYQIVARTQDDAVGEAFDKSAGLLGLAYPGGPALAKLATEGNPASFKLPIGVLDKDDAFSFSGLKTAVSRQVKALGQTLNQGSTRADLAASIEDALVSALIRKMQKAVLKYRPKCLALSGGVAANTVLRRRLQELAEKHKLSFFLPPTAYCTDNAAMIALVAAQVLEKESADFSRWEFAQSQQSFFAPAVSADFTAQPRFPVETISAASLRPS